VFHSSEAEDAWKFSAHRTGSTDGSVVVSLTWPPPELAHVGNLSLSDVNLVLELSIVKVVDPGNQLVKTSSRKKSKKQQTSDSDSDTPASTSSGTQFVELSCGYAQICLAEFLTSPKAGKRTVRTDLHGGTPFAPTEMDCGASFQRRAGWQKFKQDVNGLNKSECEMEVTTLLGPATMAMASSEIQLQQQIFECLGYGRQHRTALGSLYGQQFDSSVILPANTLEILTYFRNLIAKAYGTSAISDGRDDQDQATADTGDPSAKDTKGKKKKKAQKQQSDSDSSSSSSSSDSEEEMAIKSTSLSDARMIRGMFTKLMDNPGIVRRAMVEAWKVWLARKPKKVDKIGADAFDLLDADGGGTVDAEEFKKFFRGEDEATRLERVFDNMVVKAFPMRLEEGLLHHAMLTAKDNKTGYEKLKAETSLLYEALISEDNSTEFLAFGGQQTLERDGDDQTKKREELPFSLAEINTHSQQ